MRLFCMLQVAWVLCGTMSTFVNGLPRIKRESDTDFPWLLYKPRRGDIDVSRPGTCPSDVDVAGLSSSVCTPQCLFDLECSGSERCCPDDCGGTLCVATTEQQETNLPNGSNPTTPQPSGATANTGKEVTVVPCQAARQRTSLKAEMFPDSGVFIPQCNADGSFKAVQCHDVTQYCWCVYVDTGTPTPGTIVPASTQQFHCKENAMSKSGTGIRDIKVIINEDACIGVDICQNGGTCVNNYQLQSYKCKCRAGFVGKHCGFTVKKSRCRPDSCLNGGLCIDKGKSFQCICPDEFKGENCKEAVTVVATNGKVTTLSSVVQTTPSMPDLCFLPLDLGRCAGQLSKWFYDTETEQCRPFVFTGCRGNENNFKTYDDCQSTCPKLPGDPCSHPIVTGRCKNLIPRWAYSTDSGTCVQFVYGGCGPTGNNFLTRDECMATCIQEDEGPHDFCSCNPITLSSAFRESDFVLIGTVLRKVSTQGQLRSLVVEFIKAYKSPTRTWSRHLNRERQVFIRNIYQETRQCQGQCLGNIEDGKRYIFTGILTTEGGTTAALLTRRSYVKRANAKRTVKLMRMDNKRLDQEMGYTCGFGNRERI